MLLFLITVEKYSKTPAISVPFPLGSKANTVRIILKIWLFPFLGGINCSTLLVKKITPTLSLFLIAEKARIAANSVANSLLNCS